MSVILGAVPHGRKATRFRGGRRETFLLVREPLGFRCGVDPASHAPEHWNVESLERLSSWLSTHGATSADLLAPYGVGSSPFFYGRNVGWKSLPIVENPVHDHGEGGVTVARVDGATGTIKETFDHWRHHRALLLESRAVVYDAPTMDERTIWKTLGPVHRDLVASGVPVFHFDGQDVRPVPVETIVNLVDRCLLYDRLSFNLHANLAIFVSRAAIHLAARENWAVERLRRMMGGGPGRANTSPLGLQLLYDLLDVPGVAKRVDCTSRPAPWTELVKAARRWTEYDGSGRSTFVWKGNGSYPELRVRPQDGRTGTVWAEPPARCLGDLAVSGHVGIGEDGELRLTRDARRVMETLGDGARDRDLPLRWVGKGMDSCRSVDRWLNATMRKVKRSVAPLSATPHVRRVEAALPFDRNHGMTVYANVIDLPDEIDEATMADVEALKAMEDATPFHERRFGLVRTPSRVVADRGCAIWFGVPLGILHPYRHTLVEKGDLRLLDEGVEEAKKSIPASLAGRLPGRPNEWLVVQWTAAPECPSPGWIHLPKKAIPANLVYPKLAPL